MKQTAGMNLVTFIRKCQRSFFFKFCLEYISPFRGATNFPVFGLLMTFQSQDGSFFACFLACVILRFSSGATPTDCTEVSIATEPFQSTYLQMCPQTSVEVQDGDRTQDCLCSKHSAVYHSATQALFPLKTLCITKKFYCWMFEWNPAAATMTSSHKIQSSDTKIELTQSLHHCHSNMKSMPTLFIFVQCISIAS